MASVSDTELARDIRNGEIANIYYFFGKDVAQIEAYTKKLVKKLVPSEAQAMNYQSFDGKNFDLSVFSDSCEVYPMFADRVVVTVNDLNAESLNANDYKFLTQVLSSLPETTTVIFFATGVDLYKNKKSLSDKNEKLRSFCDKNGVSCDFALKSIAETGKIIASRVNKQGCTISRKAAEYLAEKTLRDSVMINNEISKLCAYVDGGEITVETIDLLCTRQLDADVFRLANAILRGQGDLTFKILSELYDMQSDSYAIIGALSLSFADIYRAVCAKSKGLGSVDVMRDFKINGARKFAVDNAFRDSSNIPVKKVRKCLEILSLTDIRIKSLRTDDRLILENAAAQMLTA